jgi:hypothetical protein
VTNQRRISAVGQVNLSAEKNFSRVDFHFLCDCENVTSSNLHNRRISKIQTTKKIYYSFKSIPAAPNPSRLVFYFFFNRRHNRFAIWTAVTAPVGVNNNNSCSFFRRRSADFSSLALTRTRPTTRIPNSRI